MTEQLALLPGYLTAHLELCLVALLIGIGVSVPLGIWVTGRRRLEQGVVGLASVIQTIPSLALLAVMVPLLAATAAFLEGSGIKLRSIGYLPAIIALSLYSVLPILRNTVTGLSGVDPAVVEAARAVGMTRGEQLRRVEVPLAMPVIVAGIRTAAVWVVGTATLSTPVGATSLGNYIFSGLQTRNTTAVLVGCVAAALLAILLDQLIHGIEVGIRDRKPRRLRASAAALIALCVYTAVSFAVDRSRGSEPAVTIGAKTFTEQYILAELIAARIADETGVRTRTLPSLGSAVAFGALASGEIDVYVDYSGTIWATLMKREGVPDDRSQVLDEVRVWLRDTHGITLVGALGFENTYALGMSAMRAGELGISRISQLGPASPSLEIGGDYEFFQRAEWKELRRAYGLDFNRKRSMDPSLMYQAVARGEVDVISAFSTDGRVAALDLVLLEDDRGVIPPYDAIVLAGPRIALEHPEVIDALRGLVNRIPASTMRTLNLAVDRDGRAPREVAQEFLDRMQEGDDRGTR
jgi:osmoprotectant transport system permease protein